MSLTLLPLVRLTFPCEQAAFDRDLQGYVLSVSLTTVAPPQTGSTFPFQAPPFHCYLQLTDAVGTFRFSITITYEGAERVLYRTKSVERTFSERARLGVVDLAFVLRGVRYPKPGLYPLRIMCNETALDSGDAALRVMGGIGS